VGGAGTLGHLESMTGRLASMAPVTPDHVVHRDTGNLWPPGLFGISDPRRPDFLGNGAERISEINQQPVFDENLLAMESSGNLPRQDTQPTELRQRDHLY
jgi:hypothetical protein